MKYFHLADEIFSFSRWFFFILPIHVTSNKKIRLPAVPHSCHYQRYIQRNVVYALTYSPVVLIQGPRQCGKTTIASKFLNSEDDTETSDISPELKLQNYITFDDITEREKVQIDQVA